ncbi:MAG: queuosine precursor transporter [Patescibacteria group bacterium]|nr:queuosine precursor transporter [Patescibacteria group bacterium]
MKLNFKLNLLLALFVGLLVGMNLLGGKITTLLGISVSVGIFMMPLTFLITDIVEEVYGKKITKQFILVGTITLVMILAYTALFVVLEPNARYEFNDQYTTIFGLSLRVTIASLIAFVISQFHDVWAFEFWKTKTKGKFLWLRNNLSTWVSQAIDTFLFMTIAFYGISDKFTLGFIITLAIPYYLFKLAFAVLDTPFVYLGVRWLKSGKESNS